MASLGHIAVGMVAGRVYWRGHEASTLHYMVAMVGFSLLSLAPDADVIAFAMDIPYGAPWGHRGATHSFVMAAIVGVAITPLLVRYQKRSALYTALLATAVVASHGVLDTFTDGGLGIALAWPFSDERMFAPWRPIPVAPIGLALLSARGLEVAVTELVYFLPLFIYALWPRPAQRA